MLILKYFAKLIKILRSGASPNQIAGGFVLGMMIGLIPLWSLHNLIFLFLIIILNVNLAMAIFSFIIFSGIAYLLDPLFHQTGYFLLVKVSLLHPLWTYLYNLPIVPFTRFYNTIVMGSTTNAIILAIPIFYLVKKGVINYREHIDKRIQKLKFFKVIKGSRFFLSMKN